MTLENTLRQQLDHSEPGGFHIQADGWSVTLTAEKAESLSCALKELALERGEPVREELRAWADRVANQATGLMEPLRVLEVDAAVGTALLRSEAPAPRDGKVEYYELTLQRNARSSASLRRYVADRTGGARETVPFVLTHDAIVKLAGDITGQR